jgi:hypothetical protein
MALNIELIVAEDKKQSKSDSGKEEVAPETETDSDAFDPSPVITESDITSRNIRFLFFISHFFY